MQKVMVIDDDAKIRGMLEFSLDLEGYEVVCAADGLSALRMLPEVCPDVILLDVMMPELDGFDVAKVICADAELGATPIVMLTALAHDEDVWAGWKSGIASYITKPLDIETLVNEIERVLAPVEVAA